MIQTLTNRGNCETKEGQRPGDRGQQDVESEVQL